MDTFFDSIARAVFRTQLKVYGWAFLEKFVNKF